MTQTSNRMEPNEKAPLVWRVGFVGVLLLASFLFFAKLEDRALWSEEVRWAVIAREMIASGDYFRPTINGHIYYDKPLGSYWLVVICAWLRGGVDEAAARWPSALSGLIAVAVVMCIGKRLYSVSTALFAGIVLATSLAFVVFSRTASADAETVAGVLVALWLCIRQEAKVSTTWIVAFWVVMALTSLTKGLLGFALPLLVFALYRFCVRDGAGVIERQRWFFNRTTPMAAALALAVYVAPFLWSLWEAGSTDGLDMVWRENIRRFFDAHNHRGPFYLYGYVVFVLTLPWCVLLPAALWQAHAEDTPGDRFALAYFWGVFLFFTLASSRRSYYLLPIAPAVSLLVARLLTTPHEQLRPWARRLMQGSLWLIAAALLMGGVWVVLPRDWLWRPLDTLPPLPAPEAFAVAWSVAVITTGIALFLRPPRYAFAFTTLAVGMMTYLFLFALPDLETYRTQRPFLLGVREQTGGAMNQLVLYRTHEAVYYLDQPPALLPDAASPDSLRAAIARGARWVLVRERDWPSIEAEGRVVSREPIHPWDDDDVRASKLVLLEVNR